MLNLKSATKILYVEREKKSSSDTVPFNVLLYCQAFKDETLIKSVLSGKHLASWLSNEKKVSGQTYKLSAHVRRILSEGKGPI